MFAKFRKTFLLVLGACAASCSLANAPSAKWVEETLESGGERVWISVDGGAEIPWTLAPEVEPDVFSTICAPDNPTKVRYRSASDEIVFEVSGTDRIRFAIVTKDARRAINELRCLAPRNAYQGDYSAGRPSAGLYPADLDPILQAYFDQNTPGAITGVWKDGESAYVEAIGLADVEAGRARSVEDPFEIASIAKEFTAVSVMQLVERGKLSLDDNVGRFFPRLPYGDTVKIKHLLAHTSGLGNRTYTSSYTIQSPFDPDAALEQLATSPLAFKPGASYEYSNAGMTLAALIAEKASGQSRADYIREHLLKPAGMTQTRFLAQLTDAERGRYLIGYSQSVGAPERMPERLHPTAPFGSGDLVSTLADLRRWHTALKDGSLISRATFERMITPVTLADGTVSQRGLAFMVGSVSGERLIYNSGDIYTHTRHAFLADRDLSIIVNTNVSPENDFDQSGRIRNQLIGKLMNTRFMQLYGEGIDVDGEY